MNLKRHIRLMMMTGGLNLANQPRAVHYHNYHWKGPSLVQEPSFFRFCPVDIHSFWPRLQKKKIRVTEDVSDVWDISRFRNPQIDNSRSNDLLIILSPTLPRVYSAYKFTRKSSTFKLLSKSSSPPSWLGFFA